MPKLSTASKNLLTTSKHTYIIAKPDLESYLLAKTAYLLAKGADINAADEDGMTAFMYCAQRNQPVAVLKYLAAAGANIFAKNNDGQTALDIITSVDNTTETLACLYELYGDYFRAKYPFYETFSKRIHAQQQKINQAIMLHELVISHKEDFSYGEYRTGRNQEYQILYPLYPAKERIIDYLKMLLDVTQYYHQTKSTIGLTDQAIANTITRLSMHEFALYTKDEPLPYADFTEIMAALLAHAKNCAPNIHLVASTLPVQYETTVFNTLVYIECGPQARLKTFTKVNAARIDFNYSSLRKFKMDHFGSVTATVGFNHQQPLFFHDNVFISTTSGGAQFLNSIDICRDHICAHALTQLQSQLQAVIANKHDVLVPQQISYMIVSNQLGTGYTAEHALANEFMLAAEKNSGIATQALLKNDIPVRDLNTILQPYASKYRMTAFSFFCSKINMHMFTPPFGNSFDIQAYTGRVLTPAKIFQDKFSVIHDFAAVRKFMLLQPVDNKIDRRDYLKQKPEVSEPVRPTDAVNPHRAFSTR